MDKKVEETNNVNKKLDKFTVILSTILCVIIFAIATLIGLLYTQMQKERTSYPNSFYLAYANAEKLYKELLPYINHYSSLGQTAPSDNKSFLSLTGDGTILIQPTQGTIMKPNVGIVQNDSAVVTDVRLPAGVAVESSGFQAGTNKFCISVSYNEPAKAVVPNTTAPNSPVVPGVVAIDSEGLIYNNAACNADGTVTQQK